MENKASITALMSAFGRAWHTEHEENPIFADYKAITLLTDEEYKMMSAYILSGIDFFAPEKKGAFIVKQHLKQQCAQEQSNM